MAFLPENLPPMNGDPNESSEDELPNNPNHLRKGIMDHQLDCSDSLLGQSLYNKRPQLELFLTKRSFMAKFIWKRR